MLVAAKPIDIWDVGTFDSALIALLEAEADLIRNYLETDRQIFLFHDLGNGPCPLDSPTRKSLRFRLL
jgi:hypothetical protein